MPPEPLLDNVGRIPDGGKKKRGRPPKPTGPTAMAGTPAAPSVVEAAESVNLQEQATPPASASEVLVGVLESPQERSLAEIGGYMRLAEAEEIALVIERTSNVRQAVADAPIEMLEELDTDLQGQLIEVQARFQAERYASVEFEDFLASASKNPPDFEQLLTQYKEEYTRVEQQLQELNAYTVDVEGEEAKIETDPVYLYRKFSECQRVELEAKLALLTRMGERLVLVQSVLALKKEADVDGADQTDFIAKKAALLAMDQDIARLQLQQEGYAKMSFFAKEAYEKAAMDSMDDDLESPESPLDLSMGSEDVSVGGEIDRGDLWSDQGGTGHASGGGGSVGGFGASRKPSKVRQVVDGIKAWLSDPIGKRRGWQMFKDALQGRGGKNGGGSH